MVDSARIKKLKGSLKSCKGHLTIAINQCQSLCSTERKFKARNLKAAITTLEERWAIYEKAYFETDKALHEEEHSDDAVQAELSKFQAARELFNDSVDNFNDKLDDLESAQQVQARKAAAPQPLKLPPVQLPKFSGDQLEYEAFWDQFQAQIGQRTDIEPVNKLVYLKSLLTDTAFELIKSFPSTDDSYDLAIQLLKSTYGDEQRIKVAILNKIMCLPNAKHCYKDLESFRLSLENLSKCLKVKHDYTCCQWIIETIFQNKLPGEMIQQLYNRLNKHYFTLDEMSEGVRNMLDHLNYENTVKQVKKCNLNVSNPNEQKSQKPDSTAIGTYFTSTAQADANPSAARVCNLCYGEHAASRCPKYVTVTTRLHRIRTLKLCERCLGKHYTSSCRITLKNCPRCKDGIHHTALCQSQPYSTQSKSNFPGTSTTTAVGNSKTSSLNHCGVSIATATAHQSTGALPTALAKLVQGVFHQVRLFFDAGSQMTFITQALVDKASIPVAETINLTLSGFMNSSVTGDFPVITTVLQVGEDQRRIRAVVVDTLPTQIRTAGLTQAIQQLQAKGIAIADPHIQNDTVGPVDILIGSDQYYKFVADYTVVHEGIHLMKTSAGHSLTGPIPVTCLPTVDPTSPVTTSSENMVVVMKVTNVVDPLNRPEITTGTEVSVHKLWDLDVIGIDTTKAPPDETRSYQDYLDTVQYGKGQYWVKLPWRADKPELPVNYRKAFGQMHSLVRELQKRDNNLQLYHQIIQDQQKAKFIEEVPNAQPTESCHYLPHHAVAKDSVTTPLRIVFNCSAKETPQSASLNDCLMTGPSLTEKIGDVLMKFRTGRFAYTADIAKAFLRVGLQKEDRDFTRFLWPEDPGDPQSRIKTYRFRSVLFGATSSPFLLQATLDYHLKHSTSALRHEIASQLYIDNLQGGTSDEQYLMAIYTQANEELQRANMPLQQWTTNHPMLKARIERDFPDYQVPDKSGILGLKWSISSDELCLKQISYGEDPKGLTKRSLLAKVSRAFDPLGLFTPITIKGKMLIQKAWVIKVDWDEILPGDIAEQWETISSEFGMLHTIPVPREVGEPGGSYNLHVFCDASTSAYGAVAYLVSSTASRLITSKARVSPLKTRTVPQLELTALLVGTKLGVYINKVLGTLEIQHTYVWSDNEAALQWLRNNNSKITYVQNRVAEIREIQSDFSFLYVETKSNPADYLSRGIVFSKFQSNLLWFHGPEWLPNETQWPKQKAMVVSNCEVIFPIAAQNDQSGLPAGDLLMNPIEPTRFSSLSHLLRVTTLVFKFINNLYERQGADKRLPFDSPLEFWVKQTQVENYSPVLSYLRSKKDSSNSRDLKIIKDLGLYLDPKGIIRCRGRLQHSELEYAAKHPILLPKTSWLSHLIIMEAHVTVLHGGVSDTLTHIRQQFWIPQGRQSVKSYIRKCKTCIRYDGRTCQYPGPPPLPVERVRESRPFEISGVDFTGAITISNTPNGEPIKVYVCLFTCATTRAVHLELATDLTADTFLKLFRRFAARRSCPRLVISDNGTNLKAVGSFLRAYFALPEVQSFFSHRRCEWKFIPPRAPWQGGFYERCIGIVKRCLRKVLHNKRITLEELRTLLVEIETRVNNRPLTYVNEDINEPEALTPSHLLTGNRIEPIPPAPFHGLQEDPDFRVNSESPTIKGLNECFKTHTKLLMKWNKLWREDYLTSLREYHYGAQRPITSNPLKPGDVVLVECDSSRAEWPLGRVISIHPDENDTLRLVKIKSKGVTSLRTVEKLIPFEISLVGPDIPEPQPSNSPIDPPDRPSRQSARQARSHWRNLHSEGAI